MKTKASATRTARAASEVEAVPKMAEEKHEDAARN
jgi:hypothetical protein